MDDHPTQRAPNTFLFFHPLSALLSEDMEQLFPCRAAARRKKIVGPGDGGTNAARFADLIGR